MIMCSRCTTKVNFYYQFNDNCVKSISYREMATHSYSKGRVLEGSTDKHMVQTIENKETAIGDVKPSSPIAQSSW